MIEINRERLIIRKEIIAAWLMISVLSLALLPVCGTAQQSPSKQRIVVASGVRLRSSPNRQAGEVAKLELGTVVEEIGQSSSANDVSPNEVWYRVLVPGGKEGWIFGALAESFDSSRRAEIYRKIAAGRLKIEEAAFGEWSDLEKFLSKAITEVRERDALAELELSRLLATKRALVAIPLDQVQEPIYQNWIKAREKMVVYSEPAGQWFVRSDLFWDLQKKYSALPLAERIAWEGAKNPLGGECEGYLPCHLAVFNLTEGRYLSLYANGAHANEAVDQLAEMLGGFLKDLKSAEPPDPQDRAEAQKEIRLLRLAVTKTSAQKKAVVLSQLDSFEKYYR